MQQLLMPFGVCMSRLTCSLAELKYIQTAAQTIEINPTTECILNVPLRLACYLIWLLVSIYCSLSCFRMQQRVSLVYLWVSQFVASVSSLSAQGLWLPSPFPSLTFPRGCRSRLHSSVRSHPCGNARRVTSGSHCD